MTKAIINPEMLTWARDRARLTMDEFAQKLKIKCERLIDLENGTGYPTFNQAQKIAKYLHIPLGYLYLNTPPVEILPIPDLRTMTNQQLTIDDVSLELRETINHCLVKQDWYGDYLTANDVDNLSFIGKYSCNTPVNIVVDEVRALINLNLLKQQNYFRGLVQAIEDIGVLVFCSGVTNGNTHRPLNIHEFRGFAISHPKAPVIFINSKDAETARVFTLIHEFAHLLIGQSGISHIDKRENKVEQFCNAVAGQFLVPENKIREIWDNDLGLSQVDDLKNKFNVSGFVIVRRALDLQLVTQIEYDEYYNAALSKRKKDAGGNYYASKKVENSKLSMAVISETLNGNLFYKEATNLLGISLHSFDDYARHCGL